MFIWHSMPVMWNQGNTPRTMSSSHAPMYTRCNSQLATRFLCVISAALAVPVVSEVYWSSAVSSSVRGTWEIGRDFKISRKASVSGQGRRLQERRTRRQRRLGGQEVAVRGHGDRLELRLRALHLVT